MKKGGEKKVKGVKFIDIKSVFFKTILQNRTGTTCKARLQFSPLTYRSSSLIVQWAQVVTNLLTSCNSLVTTNRYKRMRSYGKSVVSCQ